MAKLEIPQLPVEMAHQQAVAALGGLYALAIRALVDKFGSKEALKILHPYLRENGKETGAMAEMLGFTSKDAIAIASLIHLFEKQVLLVKGEPTKVSPNRVVKEMTECPFQSLAPEACLSFQSLCDGICQAINPDYKWTLAKCIPKGDPICQWVVEKK